MAKKPRIYHGEPIDGNSSYRLGDFMRRAGLNEKSMRTAKKEGLKVRRVGRNHHVLGRDWIEFLQEKGKVVQ